MSQTVTSRSKSKIITQLFIVMGTIMFMINMICYRGPNIFEGSNLLLFVEPVLIAFTGVGILMYLECGSIYNNDQASTRYSSQV
jgi:hypothetical protein